MAYLYDLPDEIPLDNPYDYDYQWDFDEPVGSEDAMDNAIAAWAIQPTETNADWLLTVNREWLHEQSWVPRVDFGASWPTHNIPDDDLPF